MFNYHQVHPNRYKSLQTAASNISQSYFRVDCNDPEFFLRRPPGELANPIKVISNDYQETHAPFSSLFASQYMKTKQTTSLDNVGVSQTFLTEINQFIVSKKYKKLISYAKLLNLQRPNLILIPYIGYMAAICSQSREDELYFVKMIERSPISSADYPQFIHLLDEIRYTEYSPKRTPLLIKFLKFSISDLNKVMSGGYRIIPGYYQKITDFTIGSGPAATMALSVIRDKAAKSLPALKIENQTEDKNENQNKKRRKS